MAKWVSWFTESFEATSQRVYYFCSPLLTGITFCICFAFGILCNQEQVLVSQAWNFSKDVITLPSQKFRRLPVNVRSLMFSHSSNSGHFLSTYSDIPHLLWSIRMFSPLFEFPVTLWVTVEWLGIIPLSINVQVCHIHVDLGV